MRSSFVGAAKKEVYYFWRHFALVYEIDRCVFRNLYLFGVTWHWYWSASLSLSAFLCYRLSSKIRSNWQPKSDGYRNQTINHTNNQTKKWWSASVIAWSVKLAQTGSKGCWREQSLENEDHFISSPEEVSTRCHVILIFYKKLSNQLCFLFTWRYTYALPSVAMTPKCL